MNQHKVSVIITYYNNENSIEDCLNSVIKQSFSDIEIICINNGSTDETERLVQNFALSDGRIKLINLPEHNDLDYAKQIGFDVVSSDFVCFISPDETIEHDFIKNHFLQTTKNKLSKIKNKHLYRTAFIENDEEINNLIQDEINLSLNESQKEIDKQKNQIRDEFNSFYQSNLETIKNNSYEVLCRCNQLEKLVYDKDYEYKEKLEQLKSEIYSNTDEKLHSIYKEISKIYEYINSEISKKSNDIETLFSEIKKNYDYTEELTKSKLEEAKQFSDYNKVSVWNRTDELEKEIIVRYVNIKRLLDVQIDDLDSKIKASDTGNNSSKDIINLEKTLSDNIDKIYSRVNETSSVFYEELSKIYREINDKLVQKNENDKYILEQRISELRNEFDEKIKALKQEITG